MGGRASTTATTVEPASAAATTRGRLRLGDARRLERLGGEDLLGLEVDREDAAGGGGEGDHGAPAIIDATTAVARRPAAAGAKPFERAAR